MRISFLGDIHGHFEAIDIIAKNEDSEAIIQVGDFGVYPSYYPHIHTETKVPVYFCRGNHENHDLLDKYPRHMISPLSLETSSEIKFPKADNIYFCDNGSILTLNGKKILFLGGANSIDKGYRKEGISWWRQEVPSYSESIEILDIVERNRDVDFVVSHTVPESLCNSIYSNSLDRDPTRILLERVMEMVHPSKWIFGHFHRPFHKLFNNIEFIGLDMFENYHEERNINDFCYNLEI